LQDFELPIPNPAAGDWRINPRYELSPEQHTRLAEDRARVFNAEQLVAILNKIIIFVLTLLYFKNLLKDGYNQIMRQVNNNNAAEAKLFFIDGPGGTGKTYLFNVNII